MVDTPDQLAYKVDKGVIVNSSIVDPNNPDDPTLIRRPYYLGIGFKEKFGDFYEDWVTEDYVTNARNDLQKRVDDSIEFTTKNLDVLKAIALSLNNDLGKLQEEFAASVANTSPTVENVPTLTPEMIQLMERIDKTNLQISNESRYLTYLNNFMSSVQNPVYQKLKSIGEF